MYDVELLRKLGCSESVIKHCTTVSRKAVDICNRVNIKVDRGLVRNGALMHDIGRSRTNGITHALIGAELAKKLGMDRRIVSIIERHIGAGITAAEAVKLGLPSKDYCPKTPEEKIVAYADSLTVGSKVITFEESLNEFRKMLGSNHPSIERMRALHDEILWWSK
ncbi:MAG: TIGR00295 family protein [Candidatus Hydrothermarchaeaceae archaeon]